MAGGERGRDRAAVPASPAQAGCRPAAWNQRAARPRARHRPAGQREQRAAPGPRCRQVQFRVAFAVDRGLVRPFASNSATVVVSGCCRLLPAVRARPNQGVCAVAVAVPCRNLGRPRRPSSLLHRRYFRRAALTAKPPERHHPALVAYRAASARREAARMPDRPEAGAVASLPVLDWRQYGPARPTGCPRSTPGCPQEVTAACPAAGEREPRPQM